MMVAGWRGLGVSVVALALAGCSSFGASGPRMGHILGADGAGVAGAGAVGAKMKVVDVDDRVARSLLAARKATTFAESPGDAAAIDPGVGRGDVLDISIWEAPPAVLFGAVVGGTANVSLTNSSGSAGRSSALPEQMVDSTGRISVPFAGSVMAAGRTPDQIARDIEQRLRGQANRPQVVVRVSRNVSANVTVVGDVTNSLRVPLTAKGERLLDILAGAGGVRQPVGKTMIQITRGNRVSSLPLEQVIRDPAQNIRLAAGDVVTALFQPFSFTVLGASGTNAEINFEGTGLTLSQALGRIGGLRDERANPRGVFIFRLEDRAALGDLAQGQPSTPDGKIPVIYRLDLSNPANFFVAQSFPMSNRDVLYVSNAPLADFQKFVTMVSQLAITGLSVSNSLP
jgi:polysaccharide export outer membrane protein